MSERFWRKWTVDKPASPWGQEHGRSIFVRVGSLFSGNDLALCSARVGDVIAVGDKPS